jgi:uncharacterized protein
MAIPTNVDIIDTCMSFPVDHSDDSYRTLIKDTKALDFRHPAEYMFKEQQLDYQEDQNAIRLVLAEMDKYGIAVGVTLDDEVSQRACREHPDRFVGLCRVDPNDVMGSLAKIDSALQEPFVRGVYVFPAGCNPQVPINDKKLYPVYAKCVENGIPFFANAGVPGPRIPMDCQRVDLIDEVMYDFPDLVFVTRHGCEPWEDLAVKLMLKWPGLYYSTSAFAPKHFPKAIIDYANTRGADKIIYAGHFPGFPLERTFRELPDVPFRDHVWSKFLRENAARVLNLNT